MYTSRALMSIGMILLTLNALLNQDVQLHVKTFFKRKHLLFLSGYFFLLLLSFFWTENTSYFAGRIQVALPFLFLPFAFNALSRWKDTWYDALIVMFTLLNLGAILWSVNQYWQHKEAYDVGYGFSQMIPTLFGHDHIRFSMSVVMSLALGIELLSRHKSLVFRVCLILFGVIDIVYIHLLAAKTGLIALYFTLFVIIVRLLLSSKNKSWGLGILVAVCVLPVVMFFTLPSFKNKIGYVRYSIEQIFNDQKQANVSDEGRLISYEYALESIKQHPWHGVGLGDVFDEMTLKYKRDFTQEVKVILPHNQFLMTGMAVGIGGILYLILMMWMQFKVVKRDDFLYHGFLFILVFAMIVEPLFETQYGTCIFLFFLLLLMKRSQFYIANQIR